MIVSVVNGQLVRHGHQMSRNDGLPEVMSLLWEKKLFSFKAQRYSIGKCKYGREEQLNADASNLPAVLSKLQGEQGSIFRKLVSHLREIFATIQNLSGNYPPPIFGHGFCGFRPGCRGLSERGLRP
jgi:hypothetical protein